MKLIVLSTLLFALTFTQLPAQESSPDTWYRGNTHTHSLWSDGNDFPEMITQWYLKNGYDFMALSDHNILADSERWVSIDSLSKGKKSKEGEITGAMDKYLARYAGTNWVETRDNNGKKEVRLKKLEEYRSLFEKRNKFLIIKAEEITTKFEKKEVHINAVNIQSVIPPLVGKTLRETMRLNLQAVAEQEKSTGEPILAHLNHPNFRWSITAEDLAHVIEEKFFEVYNGHPGINHQGDKTRPGDEKLWDIANTIRLAELKQPPLFAVASDDSHNYHGGKGSPGRGWIMVRAKGLDPKSLITSMRKGDFYASSGIYLNQISWDKKTRKITLVIQADDTNTFTSELIGTRKNYQADAEKGKTGIGEILASKQGKSITFMVPNNVLYARITITSSADHHNPSYQGQKKQAWTQPVGWQ
ncbi:MAG: hypothetical protein L3J39_17535 [Verrucomicrobiales bacterium]|nr:hypothetical protein [Verrucomicrobiales bacterium]